MSLIEKQAEQKKTAIEYYRSLPVFKYAAQAAGISEDTLRNWRNDDADFSAHLNQAKAEFIKITSKRAKPEFLLERLDRETFGDNKTLNVKTGYVDSILEGYDLEVRRDKIRAFINGKDDEPSEVVNG